MFYLVHAKRNKIKHKIFSTERRVRTSTKAYGASRYSNSGPPNLGPHPYFTEPPDLNHRFIMLIDGSTNMAGVLLL